MLFRSDEKESRGVLWVQDEVQSGVIVLPYKNGKVSVEITRADVETNLWVQDDKLHAKVKVDMAGKIVENTVPWLDFDQEELSRIEAMAVETIQDEVYGAMDKAKSLKADVFGFGNWLHKSDTESWKALKDHWKEAFTGMEIEVEGECDIPTSGLSTKPSS